MVSRRSVLASVGSVGGALGLAGCSLVDSAGDPALGESHVANALGSSVHPTISSAPDGFRLLVMARNYDAIEAGLDAGGAVYDSAELRDFSRPFFDRISETVAVFPSQSWDDIGTGRSKYLVQRGDLDRDRLDADLELPSSPDGRYRGYDRYGRASIASSLDVPEQVGVRGDEVVSVQSTNDPRGEDDTFDLLPHAIDAELADDAVEGWLAEPLSDAHPSPFWGVEVERDSDTAPTVQARLSGLRFEESTAINTWILATPDAESFDEEWAESEVDSRLLAPFDDVDVRDRMVVARKRTPTDELF